MVLLSVTYKALKSVKENKASISLELINSSSDASLALDCATIFVRKEEKYEASIHVLLGNQSLTVATSLEQRNLEFYTKPHLSQMF